MTLFIQPGFANFQNFRTPARVSKEQFLLFADFSPSNMKKRQFGLAQAPGVNNGALVSMIRNMDRVKNGEPRDSARGLNVGFSDHLGLIFRRQEDNIAVTALNNQYEELQAHIEAHHWLRQLKLKKEAYFIKCIHESFNLGRAFVWDKYKTVGVLG
ncbi:MAG TPA: hypothetical protein VJ112_04370 [Rhabdochlamydiaceae bacterium]|nr:hypothetical protein [Rhabdochlamydiaceae bacterium]